METRRQGTLVDVQERPPPLQDLVDALRPVLRAGFPLDPGFRDRSLLGLRGVVARSIDADDPLSRVKAFEGLLQRLLAHYPDDVLSEMARVLFGLTPGTRGLPITKRREQAAREAGYAAEHVRKVLEPKILKQVAWQLHQDSQNYIPRGRTEPPRLEASGDTPIIAKGDVASKEHAEHEEALSRLWAAVYELRAEILRVERLKHWPFDETEPALSERELHAALAARDKGVDTVRLQIGRYVERYGQAIRHGDGEFAAEGLLRLAGWDPAAGQ